VPPVANVHAKKAREVLSGTEVICLRSLVAAVLLLPLAAYSEEFPPPEQIVDAWPLLVMNGFLIMAIGKLAWLEAIHRIPISVAVAVGSSAPAMTLLLSFVFLGIVPTLEQYFALVLMSGGILVMTALRQRGSLTSSKPDTQV
jgi:drug/metabolite transporter (DMT)-like permease